MWNLNLLSRVTPNVLTVSESGTAVLVGSMLESKGQDRITHGARLPVVPWHGAPPFGPSATSFLIFFALEK